jgi:tetratricopeptide (TPR) repeat protein
MKSTSRRRARPVPKAAAFALHAGAEPGAGDRVIALAADVLAAAFGIAALAMILGPHKVGDYMAETDFYGGYVEGVRLIQHGHLVPSRYGVIGPGYELMLALVDFVVRDLFLAARLLSLAASVAILLLWSRLLRSRVGASLGLLAVTFMAVNGHFFRYAYGALTDAPAIALQAAALFLLLTRASDRGLLAAGAAAGIAFLTRYNAVALLPAGLITALAGGTLHTRRGRAALLYTAGFMAPVVPWVLYSLAHGGRFEFQLHHNIAYEVFARARGIPWDDYQRDLQPQFKTLWDVIARDPAAVGSRLLYNVGDHLKRDALQLLGWPVASCAAIGAVLAVRDGSWRRLWPLFVTAALFFATLVPVFYSERYSLALLPYYATLAGAAFASPRFALAIGRDRRVWLKPLLAVLPLAAAFMANVKIQARVLDQLPVEVLECAATLRDAKAPGDRVIARKWHIAYHGGVQPVGFPFAKTLPELARYAHSAHARWLYVSWPEVETRPQFAYLLDTSAVVPGLTPRCVTRPHPAVLYEIGPQFGTVPAWLANDTLRAYHNTYAQVLIDGSNGEMLYRLGVLAFTLGKYDRARQALEAAARFRPRDLEVLVLLGNVAILGRDANRARAVFQQVRAIDPNHVIAQIGLGWASLIDGDMKGAGELWRPVIASTTNPNTLQRMIALYQLLGDREAESMAVATYRRLAGGP